jgi:predicted ATPase
MDINQFREKIQSLRRPTGHSQQELAEALGIQRQVLARKLSEKNPAHFTHHEVKQIVKTLAEWDAITGRSQAHELLALMNLPPSIFSSAEWDRPPLSKLDKDIEASSQAGFAVSRPISVEPSKLPPFPVALTEFVGREWLIRLALERLLQSQVRLLTLVGPGGIGKTRLGLEIGRRLVGQFKHGIFFVDLSSVSDPQWLPLTLAQVLGLPLKDRSQLLPALKTWLSSREVLLILDNFEQLVAGAELVSQLLIAAPGLKVLATSRAVLQIYGETELGVPPLELPDLNNLPRAEDFALLEQFEAIQLFVARAQAVQPAFRLSPHNFAEVAQLCVLLEGLPLSIELAVARLKLMPLPFLLERLSQSKLETLSKGSRNLPVRQQTLKATLDWSYALLEAEAKQLFNRLGIFRGNFSLAAVAQICFEQKEEEKGNQKEQGDEIALSDLLERLSELIDQSLLKPFEAARGEPRFVMLETIREYAAQKLREAGEFEIIMSRHHQYYSNLVEKLTLNFYIAPEDQRGLTELLEQDFDNFQAIQSLDLSQTEVEKEDEPVSDSMAGLVMRGADYTVQVSGQIWIARPVVEVFEYVSRAENWPEWNSLIKECRPVEPGPVEVGKLYYAVSSLLGRRQEQTMLMTKYVANQIFEVETKTGPVEVRHQLHFREEAGGTRLTFTSTNGIGKIFRFPRLVLTRVIRRGIEVQLNRLKVILEEREKYFFPPTSRR